MRVDVDELRVERKIQNVRGVTPAIEHVAVREPHGVHEQFVAHIAIVDEPELLIRRPARGGRQTDPT